MKKKVKYMSIIIFLFVILCFIAIFAIIYFSTGQTKNTNEQFVPSNDADMYIDDDLYTTSPNKDNKVIDKGTGIHFVNNELLIYVKNDTTQEYVEKLCKEFNAYIVGKNKTLCSYKFRFTESYSYTELKEIIDILQQEEKIDEVSLNLVIQYSTNEYYPISKKDRWTNDWSSIPSGANWGIEAIKAPEAWEYIDLMQDVNVGVFDQGFDVTHDDLRNRINNSSLYASNPLDHGTHVTGIIGAEFENGIGVNGVCPTANFSLCNYNDNDSDSDFFNYAMTYLVEENNSQVINISLGASPYIMFAASCGELSAQEYIKSVSSDYEKTLKKLLSKHDFVVCTSAGNCRGYSYYKSDSATYGYYQSDPEIPGNYFDNDGKSVKWNKKTAPISGKKQVMADWDYLSLISDEETNNHIIIVGAIQNDSDTVEKYSLCYFSDIGGKDIDNIVNVVAPGHKIESTVSNNEYANKDGTSMASPHVAGIAAMLYSLNSDLTGDEVKRIICETATTEVDGYKIVDAEAAVKEVLGQGSLSASVIASDNDTHISNVRVDAYIKLKSGKQFIDTTYTDGSGNFSMELQGGSYEIRFNKDGYKTAFTTIKISKNVITYLEDPVVMNKEDASVIANGEENASVAETSKEKNINGTWISQDEKYVFMFKSQEGSIGIDYNNGISVASGTFSYVNVNTGNKRIQGSFNYTDDNKIITTANLSQGETVTFSFAGDKLVSDVITLNKLPDEIITQFEGTWQNSDEEIIFENDGVFKYKGNNNSTWGYYYVLSEKNIILSNKSNDFKTYSYSIIGKQMILNDGKPFNRITKGADADTLSSLKDIIVGTWKFADWYEEYRFYNDGTWERYHVSYHGNQSDPMFESFLEGGTYRILSDNQIQIDSGGGFHILDYNEITGTLSGDGITLKKESGFE